MRQPDSSSAGYVLIPDLLDAVTPPEDGILSRTIYQDERLKFVLFGFSAGQELSEHTSAVPAVLHVISGDATITLGEDTIDAGPGAWIHMRAGLRHGIVARSPLVLALWMFKGV
jgi:quercetin dioxygenase-like cupin family protein